MTSAKSDWPKILPQSRPSLIQKHGGKEKYISEENAPLSYSITSDSTSSSTSKPVTWNRNDESSPKVSSPMFASPKWSYGSIQGLNCADRQSVASLFDADDYTPPTPPHTTISHDENDEGIYLSWTQHMLKLRGFSASTADDSDTDSTNSSLTDDEEASSMPITPPYLPHNQPLSDYKSSASTDIKETKGWLNMPFCGLCLM
ncbi:hypothetical protein VKS41_008716 [Umbelopsis sp. WA50703]